MKRCANCKIEKSTSEFSKARDRADGLYSYCKVCARQKAVEMRQRNPERIKAQKQREYQANKERYQAYHQRYYEQNKQAVQECHRQYYARTKEEASEQARLRYAKHRDELLPRFRTYHQQNRDRVHAQWRIYYQEHKEQLNHKTEEARQRRIAADPDYENARRRQYYQRIKDKHLAHTRSWRIRNKHKIRLYDITRRAREYAAEGSFTTEQWEALCHWFGDMCLACGAVGNLTIDHVIPLACGGSHYISNLQPLCAACNSSKNARAIDYRDPVRLADFLAQLD